MLKNLLKIANLLDQSGLSHLADKIDVIIEKTARYDEDIAILEEYARLPDVYIHFSDLEKLGINPSSKYNTPIGIYGYPLHQMIIDQIREHLIPFAGDRKYIHIFQSKAPLFTLKNDEEYFKKFIEDNRAKILEFVKANKEEYLKREAVTFYYKNFSLTTNIKDFETDDKNLREREYMDKVVHDVNYLMDIFLKYATSEVPKQFWYLLNTIALRKSSLSASLMRYLGVPGLHDPGKGILHPNEPEQAVIFKGTDIKLLKTIPNPMKVSRKSKPNEDELLRKFLKNQVLPLFKRNDSRSIYLLKKIWSPSNPAWFKEYSLEMLREWVTPYNYLYLNATKIPELTKLAEDIWRMRHLDLEDLTEKDLLDMLNYPSEIFTSTPLGPVYHAFGFLSSDWPNYAHILNRYSGTNLFTQFRLLYKDQNWFNPVHFNRQINEILSYIKVLKTSLNIIKENDMLKFVPGFIDLYNSLDILNIIADSVEKMIAFEEKNNTDDFDLKGVLGEIKNTIELLKSIK